MRDTEETNDVVGESYIEFRRVYKPFPGSRTTACVESKKVPWDTPLTEVVDQFKLFLQGMGYPIDREKVFELIDPVNEIVVNEEQSEQEDDSE